MPNEIERLEASQDCTEECMEAFLAMIALLYAGSISEEEFVDRAETEIKDEYLRQYTLGIGGISNMSEAEVAILTVLVASQLPYLINFSGKDRNTVSLAQAQNWGRGYILSARQAYEKANTYYNQMVAGCPSVRQDLPAYPGDGTSKCLSFCKCNWVHVFDSNGCWIGASWILADARHCVTCESRASAWSPLLVYRYEVVNGVVQPIYIA